MKNTDVIKIGKDGIMLIKSPSRIKTKKKRKKKLKEENRVIIYHVKCFNEDEIRKIDHDLYMTEVFFPSYDNTLHISYFINYLKSRLIYMMR